jgi:hypothetical protein
MRPDENERHTVRGTVSNRFLKVSLYSPTLPRQEGVSLTPDRQPTVKYLRCVEVEPSWIEVLANAPTVQSVWIVREKSTVKYNAASSMLAVVVEARALSLREGD